jgi:hypothetical protein
MCDGTGKCLTQSNINEYKYLFECSYKCQPIECPNFKLCKIRFPLWVGYCHQNRCTNCDVIWGNKDLEFITVTEDCPVCLESKKEHVKFPNCSHSVCIECFKNLNYDNEDEDEYEDVLKNSNKGKCVVCREINEPNWIKKN